MKNNFNSVGVPWGILLTYLLLSWLIWNLPFASVLLFLAFVPLFFGLDKLRERQSKWLVYVLFFACFQVFLLLGQIAWLRDVTFDTYVAAIVSHTLLFTFFQLPTIVALIKKRNNTPYFLFVFSWVIYEFACQKFGLLSPFIILGSSLGDYPFLIQNYSWIGIEGGTVWILLTNVFLFLAIREKSRLAIGSLGSIVLFPLLLSFIVWISPIQSDKKIKVAALHTYFDLADIRYNLNPAIIIDSLWHLSKGIDKETEVLLWPETSVATLGWMEELHVNPLLDSLQIRLKNYPKLNLTFGSNLFEYSKEGGDERLNYTAEGNYYFYEYNVAFTVNSERSTILRSKEIFVPFQEQIPFVQQFPFLKKLVTVVGNPNYYTQFERGEKIHSTTSGARYSPLLCYEICYPLYTSQISDENGFIAVLGNEYWNNSKIGSRIYYSIVKSMAIQNGSPLVKSSNNGISVICDAKGKELVRKEFKDTGLLQATIQLKTSENVYGYIRGYTYVLSLVFALIFFFKKEKNKG